VPHDAVVTVRPDRAEATRQHLPAFVGISAATAGATGIGMNLVVIPPGAAADAHYHDGFETAIYVLSGRVETRYGDRLRATTVNEAGDFLFIPAGVPHCPRNLSTTEPVRALVARNTASEQESVVPVADVERLSATRAAVAQPGTAPDAALTADVDLKGP
jgi:uncharacterized RmlC-like cupin family protein